MERYLEDYESGVGRGRITHPTPYLFEYIDKIFEIDNRVRLLLSASSQMEKTTPTGASPDEAEAYMKRFEISVLKEIMFFKEGMMNDDRRFRTALLRIRSQPATEAGMLQSLENLEMFWNEAVDKASAAKETAMERVKEYKQLYPETLFGKWPPGFWAGEAG
ncbi:hypothetical protein SMACR_03461 [Sordaria macrospora]|uniref:WGS project CABT00000000 data, contig 2.10 n=2 Tax=Sordaria macrospora TaxID=5147 RepID=F7VW83_SORMK|nr:uncharacterized protein SMAC_03461 [Sordaria macrospora k-hell]KAA8633001.1 hypothetical protein SMACR_03461 [Sordaria macrospora]KAH7629883.1 hypothetical protein B0T09DRAFT_264204 [Sordaria sp. MPI-SDFR-AT-0083]WPJ66578.1 hypothetical protein SMAC4_03461 [Sordaria macrospora]CCC09905.1 unnamed protein product [Sordaria macrospora k-hell]